jgi:4-aminobutyrate aminotransferase-like enzyme
VVSRSEAVREGHARHVFPAVRPYYEQPLVLERASGVLVTDADGVEYLDLFAGILTTSIGHTHPEVVERVREQVGRLGHTSTLYLTEAQVSVAERLVGLAPAGLTRAFFTNSGTEANETAIMAARMHTGRSEVVALRYAYSGRSLLASSLTAHASWRPGPAPVPGIVHARSPYTYRCPFGSPCDERCLDRWIDDLVEVIETTTTGRPAALMLEPIQGVGGFIVLPDAYLRRAAEVIRSYGGLLIADEVQTGFGRTGGRWWGIEHGGVVPDLMVMAKGIANGFPVGATLATEAVAASWNVKTISTFGGNPVSMSAAEATLDVMVREDVPERARARGEALRDGLEELGRRHAWIGDVRGKGLMQAIEIVEAGGDLPDPDRARALLEATRREGVLVGVGGLRNNVIRMGPSLLVTEGEVAEGLARLERACTRVDG